MNWYIVKNNPDIYHCLNLINRADNPTLNFFWGYEHLKDSSVPETYVPVRVELELREQEGDFPCPPCSLPTITLTDRTKDLLGSMISERNILLPVLCGSEFFYVVRAEEIECLDYSHSIVNRYYNGTVQAIKEFSFKEKPLVDKHIFRLPEIKRYLFVSDQFKKCVEDNNLKGLVFIKIA
jgi:hypothetical protein